MGQTGRRLIRICWAKGGHRDRSGCWWSPGLIHCLRLKREDGEENDEKQRHVEAEVKEEEANVM